MSKTKFIKVPVSERLPEKTNEYFTDKGKAIFGSVMNNWHVDKLRISPNWWLCEVPDREEEMREALQDFLYAKDEILKALDHANDLADDYKYLFDNTEELLNTLK